MVVLGIGNFNDRELIPTKKLQGFSFKKMNFATSKIWTFAAKFWAPFIKVDNKMTNELKIFCQTWDQVFKNYKNMLWQKWWHQRPVFDWRSNVSNTVRHRYSNYTQNFTQNWTIQLYTGPANRKCQEIENSIKKHTYNLSWHQILKIASNLGSKKLLRNGLGE